MSTRAVYGFKDQYSTHWVFVHHDGYPTGAADKFAAALKSKLVWQLPRFEANEFAAGFIAANKESAGGVRLTSGPDAHGDIEYVYLVSQNGTGLQVKASYPGGKIFFSGPLQRFIDDAKAIEKREQD